MDGFAPANNKMKKLICNQDVASCNDAPNKVMVFDNVGKTFPKGSGEDGSRVGVLGFASSVLCRFVVAVSPSNSPGMLNSSRLDLSA